MGFGTATTVLFIDEFRGTTVHNILHVHVVPVLQPDSTRTKYMLMSDAEGRKEDLEAARSNKQATQHTQGSMYIHVHVHVNERYRRKEERSK